jgi:hypothetical protein
MYWGCVQSSSASGIDIPLQQTVFKTKHTLRSLLMKTKPQEDLQNMTHFVYNIPCICGINDVGETGKLPVV